MSALLLTSCYEDKGNYDYRFDSMNQVDISNVSYQPEAYEGVSGKVIEVQLPLPKTKCSVWRQSSRRLCPTTTTISTSHGILPTPPPSATL